MATNCEECSDSKGRDEHRRPYLIKTDDKTDQCKVQVVIPGLKKPGGWWWWKKPDGIDVKFQEQSLTLHVELKPHRATDQETTGKKPEKYFYRVKRLPDRINPGFCSYKVKDNQVELTLRKLIPRTWVPELDSTGLETADSPADSSEEQLPQ